MTHWTPGKTVLIRNLARSDGTVTTAVPAWVVEDTPRAIALFTPKGTPFKNNYVVPPRERVAAVGAARPSAERTFEDLEWRCDTLRLYLPGKAYSVWLFFNDTGGLTSFYGNLEAPFVRSPVGLDSRDYALDLEMLPDGRWQFKDEAEFAERLRLGLDSPRHQARVREAAADLTQRLETNAFPFNHWRHWRPPRGVKLPRLSRNFAADFGTAAGLEAIH